MAAGRGPRTRAGIVLMSALLVVGVLGVLQTGAAAGPGPGQLLVNQHALDFGLVTVGTDATTQPVTVANVGGATLSITDIADPGGEFTMTSSCGATLAPGASCTVDYGFSPTTSGPVSAGSAITTDGGSVTVALEGEGQGDPFPLSVSPTSLDFGEVPVGMAAVSQDVVVTNTTGASVDFEMAGGGISTDGFSGSTSCGGSPKTLVAGASCTVTYTWTPVATGAVSGSTSFQVTIWSGGSPTSAAETVPVSLSGTGTFPLSVSPTSLDFGEVPVGVAAVSQDVVVTNTTGASVDFEMAGGGISTDGFSGSTSCGGSPKMLVAGASCTVTYTWTPVATGAVSGSTSFQVTIWSGGSPTSAAKTVPVSLSGTGTFPLSVSPTSLDFGDIVTGTPAVPQQVVVTNTTGASVDFEMAGGGISTDGFSGSTSCGGSPKTLAAGASCTVTYTWTPEATGVVSGSTSLQVTIWSGGSATSALRNIPISLSGNGVATAADAFPLSVSPRSLDFGEVPVGTAAVSQDVVVTNTTGASVDFVMAGGGITSRWVLGADDLWWESEDVGGGGELRGDLYVDAGGDRGGVGVDVVAGDDLVGWFAHVGGRDGAGVVERYGDVPVVGVAEVVGLR